MALAVYENDYITSSEKQQVFEWMLQENFYATNPLLLKNVFDYLVKTEDISIGCIFKSLPIEDSQFESYNPMAAPANKTRSNILHAAISTGHLLKIWNSLLKIYTEDKIVQMLLER